MKSSTSAYIGPLLCAGTVVMLLALAFAGGCTQQASKEPVTVSGVTVTRQDDSHVSVAFIGAPGMENLLELEITITDSNGKSRTQSIGSKLATTPVQVHATQTFTGSYAGKTHILITGYFSDGSRKIILDKDI